MTFDNEFLTKLAGKTFAHFGDFSVWPAYYAKSDTPDSIMKEYGAEQVEKVTADIDFLILGEKRKKGRAEAIRQAEKFGIEILDQATFFYKTRPNIKAASFSFIGGFEFLPESVVTEPTYSVLLDIGCQHHESVTPETHFLVLGDKRGKGKAAQEKLALKYGAKIISETQFLDLMANQLPVTDLNFQTLVIKLQRTINANRLKKALQMLKESSYSLYKTHDTQHIKGIVSSQTSSSEAYSCMLTHEGHYSCCSEELTPCWGLQGGGACKHILVLLLGLAKNGDVDATTLFKWVQSSTTQKVKDDDESQDLLAQTWLRYKGAQAGELDWRPMETVPEDYYAF
ncbi:hypothetical protein [Motilimonas pumila]|uniref:Uncharacterized protein n=1 Tax=Motilimonas pumila TaxID=2303987 RepID=A0A418Y9R8_9GAMM|nr:hypothetical protein [Motilimonas pumila]RJG37991.1 hypothetical protein D1Z90_19385 [Motilimonas pumila]